jgi:4-amino-4-deoxychorismate lyase
MVDMHSDLEAIAYVNYGHFTTIFVLDGGVPGLSLHLDRLDRDAKIVFGHGIDRDKVRDRLREAVQDHELPVSARVTVFARGISFADMKDLPEPDFTVKIRPVRTTKPGPLRVRSSRYQRYLPEVKHVGTFSLFHEFRLARQAGFDDVLFVDDDGWISEGSVWNVGFYDGERVILPSAPALPGVEMRLVQGALTIPCETRPVNLRDTSAFRAAFMTNAIIAPTLIAAIDDVTYEPDPEFAALLTEAHAAIPLEPLT